MNTTCSHADFFFKLGICIYKKNMYQLHKFKKVNFYVAFYFNFCLWWKTHITLDKSGIQKCVCDVFLQLSNLKMSNFTLRLGYTTFNPLCAE